MADTFLARNANFFPYEANPESHHEEGKTLCRVALQTARKADKQAHSHRQFLNKIESKLDSGANSTSGAAHFADLDSPPDQRHVYQYRQQFGVNLGSWFTLESWLTGSLFDKAQYPKNSEMDFLQGIPNDKARSILESHWDNFINDGDWQVSCLIIKGGGGWLSSRTLTPKAHFTSPLI